MFGKSALTVQAFLSEGSGTFPDSGYIFYFFSFIMATISAKELISLSDKPSTLSVLTVSLPMR